MITINFPETEAFPFLLEPLNFKSGSASNEVPSKTWIDLSRIVSAKIALNSDGDVNVENDDDLRRFFEEQSQTYRFDYIRLGCTFKAEGKEKFEKAWLSVKLSYGEEVEDRPEVWSMAPEREFDIVEYTNSVKLGSELKFAGAKIGVSDEEKRKINQKDLTILAFRDGQNKAQGSFWELTATGSSAITGSYLFHMIIRSRKDQKAVGEVNLRCIIGKASFYLFYKSRMLEKPGVTAFELLP